MATFLPSAAVGFRARSRGLQTPTRSRAMSQTDGEHNCGDSTGDAARGDWKAVVADEYARRSGVYAAPDETSFPLIASSIFSEEIKYSPQWIPCSTGSLDVEVSEFVT